MNYGKVEEPSCPYLIHDRDHAFDGFGATPRAILADLDGTARSKNKRPGPAEGTGPFLLRTAND